MPSRRNNSRLWQAGLALWLTSGPAAGLAMAQNSARPAAQSPAKTSPYIKDYVNYGEGDPTVTIPAERAMNANPGRLGDPLYSRKPAQSQSAVKTKSSTYQGGNSGTLLQGRVDLFSSACHGAGIMLDSIKTPATVLQVRGGSPAYYAGVCKDDIVNAFSLQGDNLVLNLRRHGVLYSATMRTAAPQLQPQLEQLPGTAAKTPGKLDGQVQEQATMPSKEVWKRLGSYQLALLVDRSGSMMEPIAEGNESRWLWAGKVVQAFAAQAQTVANKSVTLGTFASEYQIAYNIQPSAIGAIFRNLRPDGGTRLAPPLKEIIDSYWRSSTREKLLVLIATDGCPDDFKNLKELIVESSRRISYPGQIELVFLGIGEDMNGRSVFNYLDHSMHEEGAAADIVEQIPFSEISNGGLDRALVRALSGH